MKKLLWILGTTIVGVLWFVLVAVIGAGVSMAANIATRSDTLPAIENILVPVIFLGWIALIIISILMWKRWKAKCPVCKRWSALKLMKTGILKQEDISVLVELKHRDLNREVTGTHEQYIPGKRKTYQDTYKCKYCGNLETHTRIKDSSSV